MQGVAETQPKDRATEEEKTSTPKGDGPTATAARSIPLDEPGRRLKWLVPGGTALWLLVLLVFFTLLNDGDRLAQVEQIEVGLVELPSGLAGGGGNGGGGHDMIGTAYGTQSPRAEKSAESATPVNAAKLAAKHSEKSPPHKVAVKNHKPAKHRLARAKPRPARKLVSRKVAKLKPKPERMAMDDGTSQPKDQKPAPSEVAKADSGDSTSSATAEATGAGGTNARLAALGSGGSGGLAGHGSGGNAAGNGGIGPGGFGSGRNGARALYTPLPELPEELREEPFRTMAIARFDVSPDGTVEVDLVKPTPNPKINNLLLSTLKKWRFFPAIRNGKPVEAVFDVQIPIIVE